MSLQLQIEQLEQPVAHVAGSFVLPGLGQEHLRIQLVQACAAGQLQFDSDRGVDVLRAQQPGPVTGKFGLALPFQQCRDDSAQRPAADREEAERRCQPDQMHHHGPIHRMAAEGMPEFVADDEAHLVVGHQVIQARN